MSGGWAAAGRQQAAGRRWGMQVLRRPHLREQAEFSGVLLGLRGPWGGLDAHRAGGRGHRKGY